MRARPAQEWHAFPNLFAGGGAARGLSGPADWGYLSGSGLLMATNLGRLAGETPRTWSGASGTTSPMAALECRSVCLDYPLMGAAAARARGRERARRGPRSSSRCSARAAAASRACSTSSPGFLRPTRARFSSAGARSTGPGRDRGVVFQEHALFPWMTVRGNIEFGLKANHVPKAERDRKVRGADRAGGPDGLRGRLSQAAFRAACASAWRSAARSPPIPTSCCSDEPFSALDEQSGSACSASSCASGRRRARRCCWSRTASRNRS